MYRRDTIEELQIKRHDAFKRLVELDTRIREERGGSPPKQSRFRRWWSFWWPRIKYIFKTKPDSQPRAYSQTKIGGDNPVNFQAGVRIGFEDVQKAYPSFLDQMAFEYEKRIQAEVDRQMLMSIQDANDLRKVVPAGMTAIEDTNLLPGLVTLIGREIRINPRKRTQTIPQPRPGKIEK